VDIGRQARLNDSEEEQAGINIKILFSIFGSLHSRQAVREENSLLRNAFSNSPADKYPKSLPLQVWLGTINTDSGTG